jgi:hypothetical protein
MTNDDIDPADMIYDIEWPYERLHGRFQDAKAEIRRLREKLKYYEQEADAHKEPGIGDGHAKP